MRAGTGECWILAALLIFISIMTMPRALEIGEALVGKDISLII